MSRAVVVDLAHYRETRATLRYLRCWRDALERIRPRPAPRTQRGWAA